MDKVKFTTYLPNEVVKALKIQAINEGKKPNEILEKLILEYLKKTN